MLNLQLKFNAEKLIISNSDKLIIKEKHRNKEVTIKLTCFNLTEIKNKIDIDLLKDYKYKLISNDYRNNSELIGEINNFYRNAYGK